MWIWLSNIISGQEFGSQISLLDYNLALNYHYRTEIWLSNIITGRFPAGNDFWVKFLSGNDIWEPNFRPVMVLKAKFPSGIAFLRAIFSSGKQFWEPKKFTKMHFSIFYSEFSDFSPMTPWSGREGTYFKPIKIFGWQNYKWNKKFYNLNSLSYCTII